MGPAEGSGRGPGRATVCLTAACVPAAPFGTRTQGGMRVRGVSSGPLLGLLEQDDG